MTQGDACCHSFSDEETEVHSTVHSLRANTCTVHIRTQADGSQKTRPEPLFWWHSMFTQSTGHLFPSPANGAETAQGEWQQGNTTARRWRCLSEFRAAAAEMFKAHRRGPSHMRCRAVGTLQEEQHWFGWQFPAQILLSPQIKVGSGCAGRQVMSNICWQTCLQIAASPAYKHARAQTPQVPWRWEPYGSQLSCCLLLLLFCFFMITRKHFCSHHLGKANGMHREGRAKKAGPKRTLRDSALHEVGI